VSAARHFLTPISTCVVITLLDDLLLITKVVEFADIIAEKNAG
jgi:hypothetical protein